MRETSEGEDGVSGDEEQAELAVEPEAARDLRGVGHQPDRLHHRRTDDRNIQDLQGRIPRKSQ